jgi:FkbM family methyltransferase
MSRLTAYFRRWRRRRAQLQEDATGALLLDQFFSDRQSGVMVEVGAADPDFLSVGAAFRSRGWRVLSIEPNPIFAQRHRERGHEILEYACSDHDADDVEFTVVDSSRRSNTISFESYSSLGMRGRYARDFAARASNLRADTITVSVRRLETLLDTYAPEIETIDVLAVDVEGWELEVLSGLDFALHAPAVAVVENFGDEDSYRVFMSERGYRLWRSLPPNEVYLRSTPNRAQPAE